MYWAHAKLLSPGPLHASTSSGAQGPEISDGG